jgi:hypothetical protein
LYMIESRKKWLPRASNVDKIYYRRMSGLSQHPAAARGMCVGVANKGAAGEKSPISATLSRPAISQPVLRPLAASMPLTLQVRRV